MTRRTNWGYMQHGIVAWLSGAPDLLARRACQAGTGSRPLLHGKEQQVSPLHFKSAEYPDFYLYSKLSSHYIA